MKKIILTILSLLLVVGCSKVEGKQDLIPVGETDGDGNISTISYYKITGNKIEKVKETGWHKNKQKESESTYKDGKKDGLWTEWFDNGKKEIEEIYKDGKKDGLWTEWFDNGKKYCEQTYKDGELIDEKVFDYDGNLK